jgi:hypothetical protein
MSRKRKTARPARQVTKSIRLTREEAQELGRLVSRARERPRMAGWHRLPASRRFGTGDLHESWFSSASQGLVLVDRDQVFSARWWNVIQGTPLRWNSWRRMDIPMPWSP